LLAPKNCIASLLRVDLENLNLGILWPRATASFVLRFPNVVAEGEPPMRMPQPALSPPRF
jgi:hypothetical protein